MSKMWFILDCHDGQIGELFLGMPDPENNVENAISRALWEWDRLTKEEQERRFAFVLGFGEVEGDNLTIDYNSASRWIDIAQVEREIAMKNDLNKKRKGTWIVTFRLKLNENEDPDNSEIPAMNCQVKCNNF